MGRSGRKYEEFDELYFHLKLLGDVFRRPFKAIIARCLRNKMSQLKTQPPKMVDFSRKIPNVLDDRNVYA